MAWSSISIVACIPQFWPRHDSNRTDADVDPNIYADVMRCAPFRCTFLTAPTATAWDPEGLLSTLPAIATCLLGVFAGLLLKNQLVPEQRKVMFFLGAGVASVLAGFLWGLHFPVIKKIWTSSYVLVAGGYSLLLLGAFHQLVEI